MRYATKYIIRNNNYQMQISRIEDIFNIRLAYQATFLLMRIICVQVNTYFFNRYKYWMLTAIEEYLWFKKNFQVGIKS